MPLSGARRRPRPPGLLPPPFVPAPHGDRLPRLVVGAVPVPRGPTPATRGRAGGGGGASWSVVHHETDERPGPDETAACLLVVGAAAVSDALAHHAELLGWEATVAGDGPLALGQVDQMGEQDMVVVVDHDLSVTTPVLAAALRRRLGYVGALGSRATQAARRSALVAAGVDGDDLTRLHGPAGLDLGGRTPVETAVSIVAEMIAVRRGRSAAPLGQTDGSITR